MNWVGTNVSEGGVSTVSHCKMRQWAECEWWGGGVTLCCLTAGAAGGACAGAGFAGGGQGVLQLLHMACVSVVTALQQMAGWGYQPLELRTPQDGKGWRVLWQHPSYGQSRWEWSSWCWEWQPLWGLSPAMIPGVADALPQSRSSEWEQQGWWALQQVCTWLVTVREGGGRIVIQWGAICAAVFDNPVGRWQYGALRNTFWNVFWSVHSMWVVIHIIFWWVQGGVMRFLVVMAVEVDLHHHDISGPATFLQPWAPTWTWWKCASVKSLFLNSLVVWIWAVQQ